MKGPMAHLSVLAKYGFHSPPSVVGFFKPAMIGSTKYDPNLPTKLASLEMKPHRCHGSRDLPLFI